MDGGQFRDIRRKIIRRAGVVSHNGPAFAGIWRNPAWLERRAIGCSVGREGEPPGEPSFLEKAAARREARPSKARHMRRRTAVGSSRTSGALRMIAGNATVEARECVIIGQRASFAIAGPIRVQITSKIQLTSFTSLARQNGFVRPFFSALRSIRDRAARTQQARGTAPLLGVLVRESDRDRATSFEQSMNVLRGCPCPRPAGADDREAHSTRQIRRFLQTE